MSEYKSDQENGVLEQFPETSLVKKITIQNLPLERAAEGDKLVVIDLKDGRSFELFVDQTGRVTHLLQNIIRPDGTMTGSTKLDQEKNTKAYHLTLEELRDAVLSAELPDEYGVVLALKPGT